jgi:hypothetical protein
VTGRHRQLGDGLAVIVAAFAVVMAVVLAGTAVVLILGAG